ncbi:MAG: hypothetical protein H7Z41_10160 [Cytophagales bacterium]|nr:hypothetical protein [Armatimonadota bacterium]
MDLSRFCSKPTRWFRTAFAPSAFVLLLVASGCKGVKVDEISRILADPTSYAQKDVTVAGRVTRVLDPSSGLLNVAAYQVEDRSGKIWVISRSGAPSVGTEVGLKARIRQDFKFGSEFLGAVLNEQERRTR